jgi:hypothetical protein
MQNKLDPRQYSPYSLLSPSGNLLFSQGIDFFNCYLSERPTGNFNITGSLKVNNQNVLSVSTTNNYGGTNVSIFNSVNTFATGTSNSILSSDSSQISGSNNDIFGGSNNKIADANDASIFGGRNVLLKHTGASILADGNNDRQKESVERYSLTIDFASGLFIKNNTFINGGLYVTGGNLVSNDLTVSSTASGLFSGNIQVLGTAYHNGSPLQNLQNLLNTSGELRTLNNSTSGAINFALTGLSGAFDQKLLNTGNSLLLAITNATGSVTASLISASGSLSNDLSFTVKTTGNQIVTGIKDFRNGTRIESLTGQHGMFTGNFVLGRGRPVPTAHNDFGISGTISFDARYLYVCTGNSLWARMFMTGW